MDYVDETKAMTGMSPEEGCFKLQTICSIAIVMNGKDGCFVGQSNRIIHCPAYPAHVIDTTGGGDFFAGAFLFGYLRKQPIQICAEWGNRLGSVIVEVMGAELPSEKWQILRTQLN